MPKKRTKKAKAANSLTKYLDRSLLGEDTETVALPTKEQISALMAQLGRKGGKLGGKRRLETMTSEERSLVARNAAKARWATKLKKV